MLPRPCKLEAVYHHPSVLASAPVCRRAFSQICSVRYADTQDENWLIGPVPGDPSLFVATGGSGHAYKVNLTWYPNLFPDIPIHDQFLPVIGRLVADAIQGVLPERLVKKFAVDRQQQASDKVNPEPTLLIKRRIDTAKKLDESALTADGDLLPS